MRLRLPGIILLVFALAKLMAEGGMNSAFTFADANAWTNQFLKTPVFAVGKINPDGDFATLNQDGSQITRGFSDALGSITEIQYVYSRCNLDDRALRTLQRRSLNTLQIRYPDLFQKNAIEWRLVEQRHCENERSRKNFFHGFIAVGANARSRARLLAAMGKSVNEWGIRPWHSNSEKIEFMMEMSAELSGTPPATNKDRCIERVKQAGNLGQAASPAQSEGEGDECTQALSGCGNCHLPRVNNCNYIVEYWDGSTRKSIRGQVETEDRGTLTLRGEASRTVIAKQDVIKTVWQNGADPIETWWNFKSFSSRGDIAHKMLALAATNGVKCTHCHEGHGDFRLTNPGQEFLKTGKVR